MAVLLTLSVLSFALILLILPSSVEAYPYNLYGLPHGNTETPVSAVYGFFAEQTLNQLTFSMDSLQVQDGTVRPGVYLYHSAQTASLAPQNPEQVNLTSAQRQVGLQDVGQDTPLTGPNIQHISHASNSTPHTHDTSAVRAYVGATYHAGDRFARDDLVPIPPGPPRHRNPRRPSGYHCNECGRAFDRMRELNAHVRTHHNPTTYHCGPCNEMVRAECPRERRRHENTRRHRHNVNGNTGAQSQVRYSCTLCSKSYTREDNLLRHQRHDHGEQPSQQTAAHHLPIRLRQ